MCRYKAANVGLRMSINLNDMIEKKSFAYVSNIFKSVRNKSVMTKSEIKLSLMIISKLSPHKCFFKKEDISDPSFFYSDNVKQLIKNTPRTLKVTKSEFMQITGSSVANFRRNFKNTTDGLVSKKVDLPNPFEPENKSSYDTLTWLNHARYYDSRGYAEITINEFILPYLLVFTHYSMIELEFFLQVNNPHSLQIYLLCKLYESKHKKNNTANLDLELFKQYLGLSGKYKVINMFKDRVLDVAISEINEKTDINLEFTLIKTAKKVTHIDLSYYKKDVITHSDGKNSGNQDPNTREEVSDTLGNDELENNYLLTYVTNELKNFGFNDGKIQEILATHEANIIDSQMDKLRGEIKKGKEIKSLSGYFLRMLSNISPTINSDYISDELKKAETEKINSNRLLDETWNVFETNIQKMEKNIDSLYSLFSDNSKIYEQADVESQENLKLLLEHSPDALELNRNLMGLYIQSGTVNVSIGVLQKLVTELEIAEISERIPYLKKAIELKQKAVNQTDNELDKSYLESQIAEIKDLIIKLI